MHAGAGHRFANARTPQYPTNSIGSRNHISGGENKGNSSNVDDANEKKCNSGHSMQREIMWHPSRIRTPPSSGLLSPMACASKL